MRHLRSKFFYLNPSRNIFRIGSQKRSTSIKHVCPFQIISENEQDRSIYHILQQMSFDVSTRFNDSEWLIFFRVRESFFFHSMCVRSKKRNLLFLTGNLKQSSNIVQTMGEKSEHEKSCSGTRTSGFLRLFLFILDKLNFYARSSVEIEGDCKTFYLIGFSIFNCIKLEKLLPH